jgi:hypothetical protein
VPPAPPVAATGRSRRRAARATIGAFAVAVAGLHLATACALDVVWPQLRDPEYGRRASALRERIAENPGRPLVLVVGSSRAAMGVKPAAWEVARPGTSRDPLLFNVSALGGGPITELLTVRRVFADGLRPTVVLLEYWPPLLRQDGEYSEATQMDLHRLRWGDLPVVQRYFPEADKIERWMCSARLNALTTFRTRLLTQADPEWVPKPGRLDVAWTDLDGWGWLPGMAPVGAAARQRLIAHQRPGVCARLNGWSVHPDADRALREAVATLRARGATVGLLYLPESSACRGWYPPEVERAAEVHLATLVRDLAVPVIDARRWMDDCDLADGYHLSRTGAAAFTQRLGPVVAATFPAVGGEP